MIDLDEEMQRMQKMLDRRERMALGVTCTEMIELITRLREAEMDAERYRWVKLNVENDDADFVLERPISEWDCAIDEVMKQAMKEKCDE